jgi:hypothetical protein
MTHYRWILFTALLGLLPWANASLADDPEPFRPELVGVDLAVGQARPGDPVSYTLKFRNTGRQCAERDYRVFTHFEHPGRSCDDIVIHADHECGVPPTRWQKDLLIVDGPHVVTVPDDAIEGEYHIHVGLFDYGGSGGRLLDQYGDVSLKVSKDAPAIETVGPRPLSKSEAQQWQKSLVRQFTLPSGKELDTANWRFRVDPATGQWSMLDKQTDVLWTSNTNQSRFGQAILRNQQQVAVVDVDHFDVSEVTDRGLRLTSRLSLDGQPSGVEVTVVVEQNDVTNGMRLAYSTRSTGKWKVDGVTLLEQALQVTDADRGSWYVPHRLGIEFSAEKGLPGNRAFTPYNDLSMAMCGATKQGSALLVSWSEVDSRLQIHTSWPELPWAAGGRACTMSLYLEGAENGCLIQPLGPGSYVEIARAYRPVARAAGWRTTWSEKRKQYPSVDRIFGAADFKPFVLSRVLPESRYSRDGREHTHLGFTFDEIATCAEHWRTDLQIDRAFVVLAGWINGGYDNRHPDVLPPAPECGGAGGLKQASRRIRDCGYLFGLHDNYQDMYKNAPSWGEQWLNKDSHGIAKKGGNWAGGQAWQVCATQQVELAARTETNLPAIARLFEPSIYFIDTVFAWPLVTCEDPAHPMSRRDDLYWKSQLCLLAKKHCGLFGSEEGREWAVPCADYLEGIFGHQTDSAPGEVIPLFPLVYSDCVQIMTHQGNRIGPGDAKKVTDHVLFAEMFLPRFGTHLYWEAESERARERETTAQPGDVWARGDRGWGQNLCRTDRVIKNVWEVLSPLNVITAEQPLDDHKFLTPDRLVQQTRFGDLTITVAYQQPATVGDHRLPANGFIVEGPTFIAFHALKYNGFEYASPTMFTARSLDQQPIHRSQKVRIYHGFGEPRLRLFGKEFHVDREAVVSLP